LLAHLLKQPGDYYAARLIKGKTRTGRRYDFDYKKGHLACCASISSATASMLFSWFVKSLVPRALGKQEGVGFYFGQFKMVVYTERKKGRI
jgi:hypothetical protein